MKAKISNDTQTSRKAGQQNPVDFICDNLSEDIEFIQHCINVPENAFIRDSAELCAAGIKNPENVFNEMLQDFRKNRAGYITVHDIRAYSAVPVEDFYDYPRLVKEGLISVEQAELVHCCLLLYVKRRFDEYKFFPEYNAFRPQVYDDYYHRGYDFLLGIVLTLEILLGMHVLFNEQRLERSVQIYNLDFVYWNDYRKQNLASNPFISSPNRFAGVLLLMNDYRALIRDLDSQYSSEKELEEAKSKGVFKDEKDFADKKSDWTSLKNAVGRFIQNRFPQKNPYCSREPFLQYLENMLTAICFNNANAWGACLLLFCQADYARLIVGMEQVHELFSNSDTTAYNNKETRKKLIDAYHLTVYNLMDELNLNGTVFQIEYIDKLTPDARETDRLEGMLNGKKCRFYRNNPAAKYFTAHPLRSLRREITEMLQGKYFVLEDRNGVRRARFPMMHSLGSSNKRFVEGDPYDGGARDYELLVSYDYSDRLVFMTMEYTVEEFPANCFAEFLNPDVFFYWLDQKQLLCETKEQNERLERQKNELEKLNALLDKKNGELSEINKALDDNNKRLRYTIDVNSKLVQEISHNSTHRLSPDTLERTGRKLYEAKAGDPSLPDIKMEGVGLFARASGEAYMRRRLNELSFRFSAASEDDYALSIKRSVTQNAEDKNACSIEQILETVIRDFVCSVLFDANTGRMERIRENLGITSQKAEALRMEYTDSYYLFDSSEDLRLLHWFRKHFFALETGFDERWFDRRFVRDGVMYNILCTVLYELLLNAATYAEDTVRLQFGCIIENRRRVLSLTEENRCADTSFSGGKRGVKSIADIIGDLNEQYGMPREKAVTK